MGTLVIARSQASQFERPVLARVTADECSVLLGFKDGSLRLEPLSKQAPTAGTFRLCLERGGAVDEELCRPLAALQCLAEGILLSQRGSGKLLYCPQPASVDLSSPVFLFSSMPGYVTSVAANPSGGLLAATSSGGELCVWGAAYGAMLARVAIPTDGEITAVGFLADDLVATSSSDGNICVWRLAESSLHLEAQLSTSMPPVCLTSCDSAAGALLVVGTSDGLVAIYGRQEGSWTQISCAQGCGGAVSSLSCCPAGALLAIARGASLAVHQLPSLELVHQRQLPSSILLCKFLRSGQLVVCQEAGGHRLTVLPPIEQPANESSKPAASAAAAADHRPGHKSVRFVGDPEPLGDSMRADTPAPPGSQGTLQPGVRLPPPPLPPHPLIHLRQQQRQQGRLCQQLESLQLPSLASCCHSVRQQEKEQCSLPLPVGSDAGTSSLLQLKQTGSLSGREHASTNTDADVIARRTLGVGAAPSASGVKHESSLSEVEEVEQPRGLPPAVARQLHQGATGEGGVPAGLSRRCGACTVFSGSGMRSPSLAHSVLHSEQPAHAKLQPGQQGYPPQLQQPGSPLALNTTGIAQPPTQRPASPVKDGVFCSMASQEAGQLVPGEGVRAMVVEHETNLAHTEVQSERLVRISRRMLPCADGQEAQLPPQASPAAFEQLQPQTQQRQAAADVVDEGLGPQEQELLAMDSDEATGAVQMPSQHVTMERPVSPQGTAQAAMDATEDVCGGSRDVDDMHPAAQRDDVPSPCPNEQPGSAVQATEVSRQAAAVGMGHVPAQPGGELTYGRRQIKSGQLQSPGQAAQSLPSQALKLVNQRLSQLDLRLSQLAQSAACRGEAALQSAASGLTAGAAAFAPGVALASLAGNTFEASMRAHTPAALQQLGNCSAPPSGALPSQHVGKTPPQASQMSPSPSQAPAQRNMMPQHSLPLHHHAFEQGQTALAGGTCLVTQPSFRDLPAGQSVLGNQEKWADGRLQPQQQLGGKEPLPRLAVPQVNSSLLVMAAQMAQPPVPVPEHVLRGARIKAATAATTFPMDAVVVHKPQAKGSPTAALPSPGKQVGKQLDPRWVAARELRPQLKDMWQPPAQYAKIRTVPFAIEFSPRQVAEEFLGLC